jgi:hypothetical protein
MTETAQQQLDWADAPARRRAPRRVDARPIAKEQIGAVGLSALPASRFLPRTVMTTV